MKESPLAPFGKVGKLYLFLLEMGKGDEATLNLSTNTKS